MTKILFRPQRGSLADAMAEVVELDATKSAVLAYVKQMCADFEDVIDIEINITVLMKGLGGIRDKKTMNNVTSLNGVPAYELNA